MPPSELRHIQGALKEKYVDHLIAEVTGLIEQDITTVLEYLIRNYGKVQSDEVKQMEVEVLNISFNPANPMVTLFYHVEQLQKLSQVQVFRTPMPRF